MTQTLIRMRFVLYVINIYIGRIPLWLMGLFLIPCAVLDTILSETLWSFSTNSLHQSSFPHILNSLCWERQVVIQYWSLLQSVSFSSDITRHSWILWVGWHERQDESSYWEKQIYFNYPNRGKKFNRRWGGALGLHSKSRFWWCYNLPGKACW